MSFPVVPSQIPWWAVARRWLALYLPLSAVAIAAVAGVVWSRSRVEEALLRLNERDLVSLQSEIIESELRLLVSDLMVLAEGAALRSMLADPSPASEEAVRAEFRRFAQFRGVYDQVRFLNTQGHEVVRVNLVDDAAVLVAPQDLRWKGDRYYFVETLGLERGEVFVSPFDLNVEDGRIEQPLKPTIRFGTPVFDDRGRKRGIVVLNYLGDRLLYKLHRAGITAADHVYLLNPQGYWLKGPRPELEWGFMYASRRGETFARYYPEVWQELRKQRAGAVDTPAGLFTWQYVHPLSVGSRASASLHVGGARGKDPASSYYWVIVSHVGPKILTASRDRLLGVLAPVLGGILVFLGGGTWFLARYRMERQQAVRGLREQELRFRQLAEALDEVFWMTTADGTRFLYVSPAFGLLWERDPAELIASPQLWQEAIHPEDRAQRSEALRRLPQSGGFDIEYRLLLPDGRQRWIWDRGFAVRDEQGRLLRVAGLAEDVTSQREAQERRVATERLAAIGEAMAGLAHESRNALQRSQAVLEMLARRVQGRDDALELIAELQRAQYYLRDLYEQVRTFAATPVLRRVPANLVALAQQTWDDLLAARNGCHARLLLEGDQPVPICSVDPHAMQQVFRNIFENAIEAADGQANPSAPSTLPAVRCSYQSTDHERTPHSMPTMVVQTPSTEAVVHLSWTACEHAGRPAWRLAIRDEGPGLSPEQAQRIFDPFFTTKVRGTGLGMAIARRLVESHQGRISVGDAAAGAEIIIVLPAEVS
jgi:PAS domain S-box-containing protein